MEVFSNPKVTIFHKLAAFLTHISFSAMSLWMYRVIYINLASAIFIPFKNCPTKCTCDMQAAEYTVDCSDCNLKHLPDLTNITEEIHRLRLSKNQIRHIRIPKTHKQRKQLWALWLDGNLISDFPGTRISHIYPDITFLNLKGNEIVNVGEHFFSDLYNLKTLYLEENQISVINPFAFSNLANLKHLYLSYNRLTEILPEWLDNLTSLNLLDLSHNKLKWIPSDLIWPVKLHTIRLSHNNISLFPALPSDYVLTNERWSYDICQNKLFCGCSQPPLPTGISEAFDSCNIQFHCEIGLTFKSFHPKLCKQNESISIAQHSFLSDLQSQKMCEPPNNVSLTIHFTSDKLMIAKCVAYGYPSPRIQIVRSSGEVVDGYEEHNGKSKIFFGPVPIDSLSCETENLLGHLKKTFDPDTMTSVSPTDEDIWQSVVTVKYNGNFYSIY